MHLTVLHDLACARADSVVWSLSSKPGVLTIETNPSCWNGKPFSNLDFNWTNFQEMVHASTEKSGESGLPQKTEFSGTFRME